MNGHTALDAHQLHLLHVAHAAHVAHVEHVENLAYVAQAARTISYTSNPYIGAGSAGNGRSSPTASNPFASSRWSGNELTTLPAERSLRRQRR